MTLRESAKEIAISRSLRLPAVAGPYRGTRFIAAGQLRNRFSVLYRAYEPAVSDVLESKKGQEGCYYNVGAHVGIHTLHLARVTSSRATILAFEPFPANYEILVRHVALNRLTLKVRTMPIALGAATGPVSMVAGRSDGRHRVQESGGDVCVEQYAIDALVESGLPAPDFLLVDVEGCELQLLEGAKGVLMDHRPEIVVEAHSAAIGAEIRRQLSGLYVVSDLDERHLHCLPRSRRRLAPALVDTGDGGA